MDPTPDRSSPPPPPPDDDQLGALVRAVVDDWQLPPQRLDQPTWRDRVGGRSTRARRGWLVRLGAAALTAITATVVVAFVAVWLTAPRSDLGVGKPPATSGSPAAVDSARTGAPSGATASVTPRSSTFPAAGLAPDPARLLVRSGTAYRIADLTTGTLEETPITTHDGSATVLPRPGGGWVCICFDWYITGNDPPSGVDINLEAVDRAGGPSRSVVHALRGVEDPTVPRGPASPQVVDARSVATRDGRSIFTGWSLRDGAAGWSAGIDVVDVATASVVGSAAVPLTRSSVAGHGRIVWFAPTVALSPSGDTVLVSGSWYAESAPDTNPPMGVAHWAASFDGRTIGALRPVGGTSNDDCSEFTSGLIDDAIYYTLCWTPDGGFALERTGTDGREIGRTAVSAMDAGLDGGTQVARHGDRLFLWEPFVGRLTRFDLRTAEVRHASAVAATRPPDEPLAALGRQLGHWFAPTVVAKVFVEPGLLVAPDGGTVYALGIDGQPSGEIGGSRGVFVFDARTLEQRGHWAPTADFVSLAISPSGRFVYAAGTPGVDAGGKAAGMQASITVYDTTDGSVRMIADELGHSGLVFTDPLAP